MMGHACNPSTGEAEAGELGSKNQAQKGLGM
jgi:hypothetical protein